MWLDDESSAGLLARTAITDRNGDPAAAHVSQLPKRIRSGLISGLSESSSYVTRRMVMLPSRTNSNLPFSKAPNFIGFFEPFQDHF
jgi:hypothetical protein